MKKILALIVVVLLLGGAWAWVGIERFGHPTQTPAPWAKASQASPAKAEAPVAPPAPALMRAANGQKYHSARQAALAAHPELQNEYKDILKTMDGQQAKLDAAMLKADPKLGPVMAKLQALRAQHSGAPRPAGAAGQPATAGPVTMTPEDWQELRSARNAAVAADADLKGSTTKIADKMRSLEDKLDDAMLKADPSLAPIIAKFEAGRHAQGIAVSTPHAK